VLAEVKREAQQNVTTNFKKFPLLFSSRKYCTQKQSLTLLQMLQNTYNPVFRWGLIVNFINNTIRIAI